MGVLSHLLLPTPAAQNHDFFEENSTRHRRNEYSSSASMVLRHRGQTWIGLAPARAPFLRRVRRKTAPGLFRADESLHFYDVYGTFAHSGAGRWILIPELCNESVQLDRATLPPLESLSSSSPSRGGRGAPSNYTNSLRGGGSFCQRPAPEWANVPYTS